MGLRDRLMGHAERLLQDPRFAKLMQDERVLRAMTKAFELRGRVQSDVDARVASVARTLNLATRQELKDLKRAIRKLERELADARAANRHAAAGDRSNGA